MRQPVKSGDVLVLCCDGLWDAVAGPEMATLVAAGSVGSAGAAVRRLVETAVARKAADNVTAVVVRMHSDRPIPPAPSRQLLLPPGEVVMRHQPGSLIDHYEVSSVLGEGAYAETYKARDTNDDRIVVLKSPNPQLFADPGIFQRFRREAEIVRSLDHPGVQRSFDSTEQPTEPYLVLEYIEGQNLRSRLRAFEGPVPLDIVGRLGSAAGAGALAYLHEHGIVHRDLKPENILGHHR